MVRTSRWWLPALTALAAVAPAACSGGGAGGGAPIEDGGTVARPNLGRPTAAEVPLDVGQCGTVPSLLAGQVLDPATIATVDCGQPHVLEVYAVFDFPAERSVAYPGAAAVDGHAQDECVDRFEDYVGTPYVESILDIVVVTPDEAGWERGDRRLACLAYHTNFELISGSVEDSGL